MPGHESVSGEEGEGSGAEGEGAGKGEGARRGWGRVAAGRSLGRRRVAASSLFRGGCCAAAGTGSSAGAATAASAAGATSVLRLRLGLLLRLGKRDLWRLSLGLGWGRFGHCRGASLSATDRLKLASAVASRAREAAAGLLPRRRPTRRELRAAHGSCDALRRGLRNHLARRPFDRARLYGGAEVGAVAGNAVFGVVEPR